MDPREKAKPEENAEKKEQEEKKEDFRGQALNRVLRKIYEEEGGPKIRPTPRAAGRFFGRTLGRGAGGAGRGAARLGGRLAVQAGMALGRAAAGGVAAAVANPVGLIVVGVIIVIVIIVFLIIMFAGGGGDGGRKLSPVDCFDSNGNNITVADGNACAQSLAEFYTKDEGSPVTAKCLDKCSDSISIACDRNSSNHCSIPNMCTIRETFCIEYMPEDLSRERLHDCATGGSGYYYGTSDLSIRNCGGAVDIPIPTPTPTP